MILVGHSCGARYSLFSAHELARRGIAVELIVCVDAAIPYTVAANVRHAANLYRSRWRIYPARPLVAAPGSAARVTNVDLDAEDSPIAPAGLHHLNITGSGAVQDWIVARGSRRSARRRRRGGGVASAGLSLCDPITACGAGGR